MNRDNCYARQPIPFFIGSKEVNKYVNERDDEKCYQNEYKYIWLTKNDG